MEEGDGDLVGIKKRRPLPKGRGRQGKLPLPWEARGGEKHMMGLGMPELIVILVIALLVFGAGKLPQVGSSVGKALREFKGAMEAKPPEESEASPEDTEKEKEREKETKV
jgi:sec-independent protein translocase protein TatA